MKRLCGQSPTRDDVQLFTSPCRRRYQSHRRWLPEARQSLFSTRSSAISFCGSRLLVLVAFTNTTWARGFDSVNNALGTSVIWLADGFCSRTQCTGTKCARRRVRSTAHIQPLPQCQPGQGRDERRPFDRSCSRKHGVEEVVPQRTRVQFAAVNLRLREWNRSCSNRVMRTPGHRDLCMLKERL
jgi:hypothetical protein